MGGTVGGATTSSPEYLTETQYYSPSDFEDVKRRGKSQENTLIGNTAIATRNLITIHVIYKQFIKTIKIYKWLFYRASY